MPPDPGPAPRRASRLGLAFAVASFLSAAAGSLLVRARVTPRHPESAVATKVESTAGEVVTSILSLPFLVVAIALALAAILVILVRLKSATGASRVPGIAGLGVSVASLILSTLAFQRLVAA